MSENHEKQNTSQKSSKRRRLKASSSRPAERKKVEGKSRRVSSKGSKIFRVAGEREMKEYPLTEGDMRDLSQTGLLASISFAIAGICIGVVFDIARDIAFASNLPEGPKGFWTGIWWAAVVVGIVAATFGALQLVRGSDRLKEIKRETYHDEID